MKEELNPEPKFEETELGAWAKRQEEQELPPLEHLDCKYCEDSGTCTLCQRGLEEIARQKKEGLIK